MDFITEIRKSSAMLHKTNEHTGFIKRIIDKKACPESYGEYLYNLSKMYKAIEDALDKNADNEVVKDFVTKELYRFDLMEKDINYLLGDKVNSIELLGSTKASIARIEELSNTKPELIVAYAYTRFLADLFGGRTFFDLFSKEYNISAEGLNYYTFDDIKDIRVYAMQYAQKLSGIKLADCSKEEFINEVNNAYIYNLAISNELETKLYMK